MTVSGVLNGSINFCFAWQSPWKKVIKFIYNNNSYLRWIVKE